ncbi:MAG TPA: thioesterase family protein [Povalibacter sp.]|nr:thioesterase family protein [Povalibacter sp.]
MSFSDILNSIVADDHNRYRVDVDESWAQGRATFGGVTAAVGNEVLRQLVPRDRPLRSLQTTFVGPAPAGRWRVDARVLRVGKAVSVARCDIFESDQVAATVVGVYGGARSSLAQVALEPVNAIRSVDQIAEPDMRAAPTFTRHFDFRWAQAKPLFSAAPNEATQAFIRHRDATVLTESHVVALIDCVPSPALAMYATPAPASSLTWNMELVAHQFDFAPDAWWRIDTRIDAAADGYVHQTGVLHDPHGRPVALTRQLVAVFG